MAATEWSIKGPHFVNCNCDYGCPCQFMALPTDGTCKALVVYRIDEGHYGDTKLDGLIGINTYDWPAAIHEGNGTMQSIIDERADDAQRAALAAILQGEGAEPGTIMLAIYRAMCTTALDPAFAPIELDIDVAGRTASLKVPGVIESAVSPLKNPVTGAEWQARIDLPAGKEYHLAEVAMGRTKATGAVPLEFTESHAHFVHNEMTSGGVIG